MKSSIFWDITPCSPLKVNRRFGGRCRLHLHSLRMSQAINQRESRWQAEPSPRWLVLYLDVCASLWSWERCMRGPKPLAGLTKHTGSKGRDQTKVGPTSLTPYCFKIHLLILHSNLHLGLSLDLSLSGFLTKILLHTFFAMLYYLLGLTFTYYI
jgi:hypothetical protein